MIIEGKNMETEIINYILKNKDKHYRMAYSYVKNKEDALDIVQDTIVKALKHQGSLRDKAYLNTWFYKILINTCKTHLQKQNRYANQSFYITDQGKLMISFDKYVVAPGYMGIQEFEIPTDVLQDVFLTFVKQYVN